MKIGKASKVDLRQIQELNLLLFKKEHKDYDPSLNLKYTMSKLGKRYFVDRITSNHAYTLVAKEDSKVLGYLVGCFIKKVPVYRTIKKKAEIESMFVLDEYRNKKIGTKLVKKFILWAKENGANNVCVTAAAQNTEAVNFYKKCSFKDYLHTLELTL